MVHSWVAKGIKIVTQGIAFSVVTATCITVGTAVGIVTGFGLAPKVVIKAVDPIPVALLYPITFGCMHLDMTNELTSELTGKLLNTEILCVAAIKTKKLVAITAAYVLKITI